MLCAWSVGAGAQPRTLKQISDENPPVWRDALREQLAFNQRTLRGDYERIGSRDGVWDEPAMVLLDAVAWYMTYAHRPAYLQPAEMPDKERLAALAAPLKGVACDDPLVQYAVAYVEMQAEGDGPAGVIRLQAHADAMLASGYGAHRKLAYLNRMLRWSGRGWEGREPTRELYRQLVPDAFRLTLEGPHEWRPLLRSLDDVVERDVASWLSHKQMDVVLDAALADPQAQRWVTLVLDGRRQIDLAWDARGNGWASTVTPEGWAGFHKHLALARRSLEEAHTLAPQHPEAAADLITVAMGDSAGDPVVEMRQWFERALTAQFDFTPAHHNFEWGLRPRWHGSWDTLIDLARGCVATGRFDTIVPYRAARILKGVADDMGHRRPFARADVQEFLGKMTAGYLAEPAMASWHRWMGSYEAAWRWAAEDYGGALAAVQARGDDFQTSVFGDLGFTVDLDHRVPLGEVYARGADPLAKVMAEADRRAAAGDWRGAAERVRALWREEHGPARPYLERTEYELRRNDASRGKEPIDLSLPHLGAWRALRGEWSVTEDGAIEGRAELNRPAAQGLVLMSADRFPPRMRWSGRVEVVDPGTWGRTTLMLRTMWQSKQRRYWSRVVEFRPEMPGAPAGVSIGTVWAFTEKDPVVAAPVERDYRFTIEQWGRQFRVWLNDEVVIERHVLDTLDYRDNDPIAIGGPVLDAPLTLRFRDLKLQELHARPTWAEFDEKLEGVPAPVEPWRPPGLDDMGDPQSDEPSPYVQAPRGAELSAG